MSTLGAARGITDAKRGTAARILDAAEHVFAERGFSGASIRDIAAEVGLNPASLYNHFPGKKELYEAVLDRGLAPIIDLLRTLASTDPGERADEYESLDAVIDHLAAKPAIAKILHYEALGGGENLARVAGRWLSPIYEQGIGILEDNPASRQWAPGELRLLIEAFHNMVLGYFATAALREKLLGEDPLSAPALERQKRFLRKVAGRLLPRD